MSTSFFMYINCVTFRPKIQCQSQFLLVSDTWPSVVTQYPTTKLKGSHWMKKKLLHKSSKIQKQYDKYVIRIMLCKNN